ncbi:MAG: metalloregulator ArsR/SmtB family transcription factor [Alkalispirochaeta sp.]
MTEMSELFRALADETRLRIVRLFLYSAMPLCVCELVDALELPQYKVSRHLAALKATGLMSASKQGTWAYHRLEADSPLFSGLWEYVGSAPLDEATEQQLRRDQQALDARLRIRENGACVVGLTPSNNFATREKQEKERIV